MVVVVADVFAHTCYHKTNSYTFLFIMNISVYIFSVAAASAVFVVVDVDVVCNRLCISIHFTFFCFFVELFYIMCDSLITNVFIITWIYII